MAFWQILPPSILFSFWFPSFANFLLIYLPKKQISSHFSLGFTFFNSQVPLLPPFNLCRHHRWSPSPPSVVVGACRRRAVTQATVVFLQTLGWCDFCSLLPPFSPISHYKKSGQPPFSSTVTRLGGRSTVGRNKKNKWSAKKDSYTTGLIFKLSLFDFG